MGIAARKSCCGQVEALHLVDSFISQETMQQKTQIANKVSKLLPGNIRSIRSIYIYAKRMWFAIKVD